MRFFFDGGSAASSSSTALFLLRSLVFQFAPVAFFQISSAIRSSLAVHSLPYCVPAFSYARRRRPRRVAQSCARRMCRRRSCSATTGSLECSSIFSSGIVGRREVQAVELTILDTDSSMESLGHRANLGCRPSRRSVAERADCGATVDACTAEEHTVRPVRCRAGNRRRRDGDGLSGARSPPRPQRRAQGAQTRSRPVVGRRTYADDHAAIDYDAMLDDTHLVALAPVAEDSEISVVLNWIEDVKKKLGRK